MKEFKQYFIIPANPEEVYLALTMEQAIRLWSGDEVSMSNTPNSEFSLWDGSITGKNLILEKDKKLVQQWYFGDQMEPSIVTIKLHPHKKGTSLELLHTNIPDTDYQDIVEGWQQVYMASLIDFFEGE
ncbi:SRPBCC domain-containing protein [Olivibacter jilunii]|uniref:SRPBCC domain-containing protein n=1 Tax=Olivibacter jilunii TaxID=985016 RepID=UPI003F183275